MSLPRVRCMLQRVGTYATHDRTSLLRRGSTHITGLQHNPARHRAGGACNRGLEEAEVAVVERCMRTGRWVPRVPVAGQGGGRRSDLEGRLAAAPESGIGQRKCWVKTQLAHLRRRLSPGRGTWGAQGHGCHRQGR